MSQELSLVEKVNNELSVELRSPEVIRTLIATTFKGLDEMNMRKAMLEGMLRGHTFKDFLEKRIYALPFAGGYSLVTSIDAARIKAMKSGLCGKKEPKYEFGEKNRVVTCTVTVSRRVDGYVGDYTATVYFTEFSTGKNLWLSKPNMMIAKVAEMHALRMGFPEEMAKEYIEEEMDFENKPERFALVRNESAEQIKMGNFLNKNNENQKNQNQGSTFESSGTEFTPENAIDIK